jgi:hypothetical protein
MWHSSEGTVPDDLKCLYSKSYFLTVTSLEAMSNHLWQKDQLHESSFGQPDMPFNPSMPASVHYTEWVHFRVIQNYNSSILGSSWHLNSSITEWLRAFYMEDTSETLYMLHLPTCKNEICP